ncbi:50S ribosomal protein L11 [Candidatus Woesearchaeota archaeon]|nr:50S ribosomal protein L11 [Candidatus Woesearchaeota archaeon]
MAKQTVEVMVEGGKATAAPPLGPALGPTGMNIGQVVMEINKRTVTMAGMQIPVKVIIDTDSKTFTIEVGTPPTSALVKKEAGVEKGAGNPLQEKIADLMIEQIIKIAKTKEGDLLGNSLKMKVKEVIGTCNSMGILVEGLPGRDALKAVEAGKFDEEIRLERTELSAAERAHQEAEKKRLHEELEKRRAEFEVKAKAILAEMGTTEPKKTRTRMLDAGVPIKIVDELVPIEKEAPAAGGKGKK